MYEYTFDNVPLTLCILFKQNGCRSCCIILAEDDPDSQLLQRTDNSGKIAIHLAAAAGHHQILQDLARFQQDLYEAEDQDDR